MRILLAEDDHNLGTWLSRALEHAGIQVEWVNDGRLADRALQQHDNYDALVLDLGLPWLDGQAVLQRLRDRDQRLPALILTARDSLDERVRSLASARRTSSSELAIVSARGFSIRTCRPASKASLARARWLATGVTIRAASASTASAASVRLAKRRSAPIP